MSDLGVIEDGAVAMSDGVITHVGPTEEVLRNIHAEDYLEIRAENQAVLPGFVDSHTHFIFGGYREEEFSWRLRGDSYMSIMERGGGIVNTMKATRESDFDTLWDRGEERLDELFSMGVTTVEGKSGYGLDLQTELVQLRVMSDLNESHPMDVVSTFLGAHAVPPEFAGRTDDYVDYMIEEVLPVIRAEHTVMFCDVFCEKGVFSLEQSERLLRAARHHRFKLKMHADEIVPFGDRRRGSRFRAWSDGTECPQGRRIPYRSGAYAKSRRSSCRCNGSRRRRPSCRHGCRDSAAPCRKAWWRPDRYDRGIRCR